MSGANNLKRGLYCAFILIVSEGTDNAQGQEENQATKGGAENKGCDDKADHFVAPLLRVELALDCLGDRHVGVLAVVSVSTVWAA